jgi:hypothetical protein
MARAVAALEWLLLAAIVPATAVATNLTGRQVVPTYEFGNASGTAMATVGPGPEFVIEGVQTSPGFSVASLDITTDTLTLTHDRSTRLGRGFPIIDDDVLQLGFPDLPVGFDSVSLSVDPTPEWFAGLAFTPATIELDQTLDNAGVNTQLEVWTIALQQGDVWGAVKRPSWPVSSPTRASA